MYYNHQVSRFLFISLSFFIGLSLVFVSPLSAQSSPISPGDLSKLTASLQELLENEILFQDDFNSATLADEWSWIREDPALWSLTDQPGWLTLTTHQGGLGDSPNLAKNLLVQDAPAGDYRIVTRLDFDPDENYALAGLLVYLDDDNYMLFGRAFCDNPVDCVGNGIYFDFVEEGILEENYATLTAISPESTYLAITKVGLDYSGWISSDGLHWQLIGTHTTAQAYDWIGLGTTNGNQPTTGIPANFDFFLLDEPTRTLPADWDGRGVRKPVVIQDGDGFKMWYEGLDFENVSRVGLATSPDGMSWTKYLGNPVMDRGPEAWEVMDEIAPFVMYHGDEYKMWYEGSDGSVRQLGYATSPDGITWTKYADNPVLEAGPDAFDQAAAAHGTVLYEGSTYKLWYHAIEDPGISIAYATSDDGINWTKEGTVLPIDSGTWEDWGIWGPSVVKEDDTYWMWYAGGALTHPSIGVATSSNGINWEKSLDNPIISIVGEDIGDPTVLVDDETFKMWFNNFTDGQIYYTESEDGTNWGIPVPVLFPGFLEPLIGHHDGPEGQVNSTGCGAFGWVTDPDEYAREIMVQVLADGELVEEVPANLIRDDVDPQICPEGTCGYAVDLWGKITAGVEHTITVQAYDEESEDWWGLEGTPKSLTCWGYPQGHHDGDEGTNHYPACSAFGWAYDPDDPSRDMPVQVLVDGEVLEEMTADLVRDDVDPLICPNETCGFGFDLKDKISLNQEHEILVQAYDEETDAWMNLIGTPKSLTCVGGKIHLPYLSNQITTGDSLSVFESGTQAFPANTAFHIMHGWRGDFPDPDIDLFGFELEVDSVFGDANFTRYIFDWSSTPPALIKQSVFNFPDGMDGTHTFNGHWVGPCYAFLNDCEDPYELWESVTNVVVTFSP